MPHDRGAKSGAKKCGDNGNTIPSETLMPNIVATAEVNIHLRAGAQDREVIGQAAKLVGSNRSEFIMTAALKAAKNIILDQSTIYADTRQSRQILDWMDSPASTTEIAGMKRIAKS
jgi:uncharacterized protein (DUF1778 family)